MFKVVTQQNLRGCVWGWFQCSTWGPCCDTWALWSPGSRNLDHLKIGHCVYICIGLLEYCLRWIHFFVPLKFRVSLISLLWGSMFNENPWEPWDLVQGHDGVNNITTWSGAMEFQVWSCRSWISEASYQRFYQSPTKQRESIRQYRRHHQAYQVLSQVQRFHSAQPRRARAQITHSKMSKTRLRRPCGRSLGQEAHPFKASKGLPRLPGLPPSNLFLRVALPMRRPWLRPMTCSKESLENHCLKEKLLRVSGSYELSWVDFVLHLWPDLLVPSHWSSAAFGQYLVTKMPVFWTAWWTDLFGLSVLVSLVLSFLELGIQTWCVIGEAIGFLCWWVWCPLSLLTFFFHMLLARTPISKSSSPRVFGQPPPASSSCHQW